MNQLHGLNEKLDFAYAAPSEFQIAFSLPFTRQVTVDLLFHDLEVFDHGVIEEPAIDERLQIAQQLVAQLQATGHRPGFEHGAAFPTLSPVFIIGLGVTQGIDDFPGSAFRSQIEIDPEYQSLFGALSDGEGDHLGQFDKVLMKDQAAFHAAFTIGNARCLPLVAGITVNQVDIGGEVQLAAPEFAHGEDDELRLVKWLPCCIFAKGRAMFGLQKGLADVGGMLQAGCGQIGKLGSDFL